MDAVFIFGIEGLIAARNIADHQADIWIPSALTIISMMLIITISVRVTRRILLSFRETE